jgi:hypothetical protein
LSFPSLKNSILAFYSNYPTLHTTYITMGSGSPPNTSEYIQQASLERSNRDSMTPLSIIRASIFECQRTQRIFNNISTRPGVTDKPKSHAEAQAAQAKIDFEEARRTYNEVYKACYQSGSDGVSQQDDTDEARTRRPHEDVSQIRMIPFVLS